MSNRAGLSEIQSGVVELIATEGLSNKEIGRRMGISDATVKVHVRNVLNRLREHGVTNRTQIALWGIDNGFALSKTSRQ